MEAIILVSAFLANVVTNWVKPYHNGFTEEEWKTRSLVIRIVNAVFGIGIALLSTTLLGIDLDMNEIQTYIQIILTGVVTFATSQGMYFLVKKS